jgi:ribosomal RNA-processing protein 7
MKNTNNKKKSKQTSVVNARHGIIKWIDEYRRRFSVDLTQMEQASRDYLSKTESSSTNTSSDKYQSDNVNDNDGWTVVSRTLNKTRQRMIPSTDKTLNRLRMKHKRASERKELTNFYQFQMTDKKVDQLEQLKMKFELDKQRILQMRQQRKFKPF